MRFDKKKKKKKKTVRAFGLSWAPAVVENPFYIDVYNEEEKNLFWLGVRSVWSYCLTRGQKVSLVHAPRHPGQILFTDFPFQIWQPFRRLSPLSLFPQRRARAAQRVREIERKGEGSSIAYITLQRPLHVES